MAEVWAPFVAEVDSIAHTVTEQGVRVGEEHRERPQAQACKQAQCARRLLGLYEAAERRPPAGRTENEQHQHREQLLADGASLSSSARSIHASSEPGGNERTRRVSARLRAVTVCGGGLSDRNLPRAEARAPARQHTVNLCIAGRGDTLKKSKYLRSAAHTRQDQPLLREESDDDDVHGGGGSMSSSICVRASDPLHQSLNRQLFALRHQAEQALLRALELRDQLHAPPTRGQKVDL